MDLRVLRYFIATVEVGSISGAASVCHVAQPSITLAISKLEDEFKCRLFDRHQKGSRPTQDGLKLYEMAKDLISHAESIKNDFYKSTTVQPLKLLVDQNIRVAVLECFIQELNEKNSATCLSLSQVNSYSDDSVDMYLTTQDKVEAQDFFFPLSVERYALLIPKDNRLAYMDNISLIDLQNQALITRIHCENKSLFERVCKERQLEFITVAEVETEEWAHALTRSGLGLCFAPIPDNFKDENINSKYINELFNIDLPERVVGLRVKPTKQNYIKKVLPYLFQ